MRLLHVAGGLAVLLVLGVALALRGADGTEAALPEPAPGSAGLEAAGPEAPTGASARRTPQAAPALVARVLGEVLGAPPQGAHVVAEDALGRSRVELQDGRFELATTTTGTLRLWLDGIGRHVSEPAQLEIDRLGAEYAVILRIERLPRLGIRFVDSKGEGLSGIGRLGYPLAFEPLAAVATATPPTSPLTGRRDVDGFVLSELGRFDPRAYMWSSHGASEPIHGTLDLDVPLPVVVSAVLGDEVLAYRTVRDADQVVEFRLRDSVLDGLTMRITGRLLHASDLAPIASTQALALDREPSIESQYVLTETDEQGRFSFDGIARRPWFLVVNVPGLQLVHIPLGTDRQSIDLGDILVPQAALISGHAVDELGAPVRAPLVWVGTVEENARDRRALGRRGGGNEREDGWFSIGCLPREPLVVGMWPERGRAARPVVVDASAGGVIELRLAIVPGVELTLAGEGLEDVALFDERGFLVWSSATDGPLGCRSLPPGDYRLTDGRRSQLVHLVDEPVLVNL